MREGRHEVTGLREQSTGTVKTGMREGKQHNLNNKARHRGGEDRDRDKDERGKTGSDRFKRAKHRDREDRDCEDRD